MPEADQSAAAQFLVAAVLGKDRHRAATKWRVDVACRLSSASTFMARVAVDAVVDVPVHAAMLMICGSLGVAVGAGEDGIVGRVGVAGSADAVGSAVVHIEPCVIEGGA